jgi:dTDP-4-dehydrorhamnose 3,5-epimerase
MRFQETPLRGAYVVEPEPLGDDRGFFARTFCTAEFREHGLNPAVAQCSISFNRERGTLRGLHYQAAPHAETRLVRCTRGSVFDVIVDLRADSGTRLGWYGCELSAENRRALYVPEGFAHGFQTLEDETELLYAMSEAYVATLARGVHYASPALGIDWPLPVGAISPRDATLEPLEG